MKMIKVLCFCASFVGCSAIAQTAPNTLQFAKEKRIEMRKISQSIIDATANYDLTQLYGPGRAGIRKLIKIYTEKQRDMDRIDAMIVARYVVDISVLNPVDTADYFLPLAKFAALKELTKDCKGPSDALPVSSKDLTDAECGELLPDTDELYSLGFSSRLRTREVCEAANILKMLPQGRK